MLFVWLGVALVAGYLSGSVSYAIIITRAKTGADIRQEWNRNPGTANVGRSLGLGWGALVLALDILKGLVPILAVGFLPVADEAARLLVGLAAGLAAILGHCRPLFHQLRGGGGIATSLALYFTFIPAEISVSILLACLVVLLFVRNVQFRIGRWIPILFVAIAPFLTTGTNLLVDLRLSSVARLGGHPWTVVAGVWVASLALLYFNGRRVFESLGQLAARRANADRD
jgi:acyl-phosphate glycerol 3-phosphate acyltransferase